MDIDLARSTSARSWTNVVARGPIDGRARHMSGRDCGWPSLWRPTIPAAIMTRMDTVKTHTVSANGIRQQVHMGGPEDGQPVLLVHGNCSSADFWQPLWRLLPDDHRIIAPDLRGYGGTETARVDAARGLRDFADDVLAVLMWWHQASVQW
jgi:hypothetical protein